MQGSPAHDFNAGRLERGMKTRMDFSTWKVRVTFVARRTRMRMTRRKFERILWENSMSQLRHMRILGRAHLSLAMQKVFGSPMRMRRKVMAN